MRAFRKFGIRDRGSDARRYILCGGAGRIVKPGYAVVTGYAGFVEGQPPEGADPVDYPHHQSGRHFRRGRRS